MVNISLGRKTWAYIIFRDTIGYREYKENGLWGRLYTVLNKVNTSDNIQDQDEYYSIEELEVMSKVSLGEMQRVMGAIDHRDDKSIQTAEPNNQSSITPDISLHTLNNQEPYTTMVRIDKDKVVMVSEMRYARGDEYISKLGVTGQVVVSVEQFSRLGLYCDSIIHTSILHQSNSEIQSKIKELTTVLEYYSQHSTYKSEKIQSELHRLLNIEEHTISSAIYHMIDSTHKFKKYLFVNSSTITGLVDIQVCTEWYPLEKNISIGKLKALYRAWNQRYDD